MDHKWKKRLTKIVLKEGREMEQEKAEANDNDDVDEKVVWGYNDWDAKVNTWNRFLE